MNIEQSSICKIFKLFKLLSGQNAIDIKTIATRLDVSERTAYRYISSLMEEGFAVVKDRGRYTFAKSGKNYTNLSDIIHFSEEEATLVCDVMASLNSDVDFQNKLISKLAATFDFETVIGSVASSPLRENIYVLKEAIERHLAVIIENYSSGGKGGNSDRYVEPYKFDDEHFSKVWCYDTKDGKCKQFKVSRIGGKVVLNGKWQFSDVHVVYDRDVFRTSGDERYNVELELDNLSHNLITEEYPEAKKHIRKTKKGTWLLKTTVYQLFGVGRFVLGLIDHVRIIDSPELQKFVDDRIAARMQ